jgi:ADP-heptose:LPS heptosyltransferase
MGLLVIRTSSMGDVIMTVPVIRALISSYPDEEIIILTKKPFDLFFSEIPGLKVVVAYHHDRHKGIPGLIRLFREIRRDYKITAVADFHDVLRSQFLRSLFFITGCRVAKIRKGRLQKWKLVRGRIRQPLKHTVVRYTDTLSRAGYHVTMTQGPWLMPSGAAMDKIASFLGVQGIKRVGVAPLARHKLKMWPVDKMISFLCSLSKYNNVAIFLFGSPDEAAALEELAGKVPGAVNIAGRIKLAEEMALISQLDLMVAMDSSNMHLASAMGIKTLSVWGATHPWAGFSAWGASPDSIIQVPVDELSCRPCTIFGKGDCRRGDLACLNWLDPDTVLKKAVELLEL